ncbi:hypothetical protein [Streptomyces sp. KS 21]|uniref:hypothetical protein n=1 Tax=Streptomyces sp. KS 21 TaxID=2485150 RepID=UPI0010D506FB|nr:hypothetical protein [Streptomyces sp. KS 21]TDU80008.1 hypothetical protein EDD91_6838 [Streptomyces sp. KS 21]
MAIFTHLIPANRRHGKRDWTSGRDDTTGRRRHRRHRNTDHGHNGHHGNNGRHGRGC